MSGYVHTINRRRGLVAISTERHGFTIVEMVGNDLINLGDRLEWDDGQLLGRAACRNVTKGSTIQVNVLALGVPEWQVRARLEL